jgi:TetR/AcrR family transcriptional repressor of nem operon
MRYSSTHKEETRKKLMASSSAIAKAGGFDSTGVDALMANIGLTGGAFYSHFPNKQALFEALVVEELRKSGDMLAGDENSPADHAAKCFRSYLSTFHVMHPEVGCVIPALGPEIARAGPELRAAAERELKRAHKGWNARIGNSDDAWAGAALCVGALMLARMVESERTRKEILAACRRFLDKANVPAAQLQDETADS